VLAPCRNTQPSRMTLLGRRQPHPGNPASGVKKARSTRHGCKNLPSGLRRARWRGVHNLGMRGWQAEDLWVIAQPAAESPLLLYVIAGHEQKSNPAESGPPTSPLVRVSGGVLKSM
jgi:hypothetical protein